MPAQQNESSDSQPVTGDDLTRAQEIAHEAIDRDALGVEQDATRAFRQG